MTAAEQTREQFLIDRRKGMGGSDVAAALGLDPKVTPYRLWREKVGADPVDAGRPAAARRGRFLEAAVLARYAAAVNPTALETQIPHVDGWRRGNQDGRATTADGVRRAVEVKTVNRHVFRLDWGAPWSDEVPDRALCQGLWYGNLDDAAIIDFAVCVIPDEPDEVLGLSAEEVVAVSDFHVFQATRNPGVERAIIERASVFWHNHVLANLPPPIGVDDIDLRWPTHIDGVSKPAAPIVDMLRQFDALRESANASKKELADLRDRILLYAEDAEFLAAEDGRTPLLTLKTEQRAAHQVAASHSRVLRFSKWWKRLQPTTPTKET